MYSNSGYTMSPCVVHSSGDAARGEGAGGGKGSSGSGPMIGGACPSLCSPNISACCAAALEEIMIRNMRTFTGCSAPISAAACSPS
jgi:hypothetical protein